ncbi:nitrilase-related carbon-nitrogen hydrolase [Rhodobacter ferrooxidans]|uniref:Nitrilase/cyanide hydratase and apolipoprotein N-acyltransferase n=1 Tax=Rhodobacter ferrooxidans TaxID=371731 RepID=C8RZ99_9RHOB|nr:nitrilase-related carbon-nitrogen hydrolase [Rhodobacter sp. SW2]EEW26056.1 Nitrilase/cyanide hydratase and apolipoprotein N-acyltransferase [Rhodobacter sp. SW2]
MPKSPLRLALWQGPSPAGNPEAAFAALAPALAAAAAMGADMLVAPELFLPGYNADVAGLAQPQGGEWHLRLAEMTRAAGCGLTLGFAEAAGDALFNSAICLDATGRHLAHYRKIQLFGPREAALFRPGKAYETFTLAGVKCALLICYDIEFAPHVAALAALGVQVILVPTANMLPYTHVSSATVPAMAANHGVAIVYANMCGTEGDLSYAGGSVIVGATGAQLAQAGQGQALLVADIPRPDPALLSSQAADFRAVSGAPD